MIDSRSLSLIFDSFLSQESNEVQPLFKIKPTTKIAKSSGSHRIERLAEHGD